MKQLFFTFVILSVPLILVGGLLYAFGHGLYTVYSDWRLAQELRQLRREVAAQRPSRPEPPWSQPTAELHSSERPEEPIP